MFSSTVDTPLGPFTAVVDADGAVLASGWTASVDDLVPLIHASLRTPLTARPELGPVTKAIEVYHRGEVTAPDAIAVRQLGSPFLSSGWEQLRRVEPGSPITYAQLAQRAGNPSAVRAAASACARNAAALFVPCHRVVRTGGAVGQFRWGPDVKRRLLGHEKAWLTGGAVG